MKKERLKKKESMTGKKELLQVTGILVLVMTSKYICLAK